ncbi:MAG: LysM domain-containing protein [Chloroflexota bacterium]|nr:LysM domain-containing protein [Chloroflexota bacterium]
MFDSTSRYANIEDVRLEATAADGQPRLLVYKRRRFIPDSAAMTTLLEHSFAQGERLDNITARYLGDPVQFWRVCDANTVLHPTDLETVGQVIRITLPQI